MCTTEPSPANGALLGVRARPIPRRTRTGAMALSSPLPASPERPSVSPGPAAFPLVLGEALCNDNTLTSLIVRTILLLLLLAKISVMSPPDWTTGSTGSGRHRPQAGGGE